MKIPIYLKIFSGYLLIVIVILTITFPLSFRAIRHHHIDTLTNNLKNLCITLKMEISPLLESNQIKELDTLVKNLGRQIDTRITIINPEGAVFADSEKNPSLMEDHKNRIEIKQAIKDGFGTSLRFSASVKEEMLYVAIPINKDGEVYGILRASLFLKEINTLLNNLKMNIIKIAVIIVVILLIGAFLFSHNFSKPLNELGAASRKVAQGDFSVKVFLKSNNEIKELADSFNYMTEQISTLFSQLSYQKEELSSMDKTKKDFVTNVSHELRTPLTAIKGFVETLQDTNNNDENQHYLNIIKKHTDRVIRIVNDLLLLSKLEGKSDILELEEVNLNDLIENILKIFEQSLKEKNLALKFNPDSNLPVIKVDPFKLEQVFINLIDNAIKYTERGEVVISLNHNNEKVTIEIEDTGICIPQEHLSRIFERFYVVDTSRSRKLGGTGLGLSIVKHIVLLHNGKIDVKNIPGTGTNFIVTLPIL